MSRHLVLCGGLAPVRNESGERLGLMIEPESGSPSESSISFRRSIICCNVCLKAAKMARASLVA